MRIRSLAAMTLVAALTTPAIPLEADVTYVRCESGSFGRYRECRANTEGRVELVRELSRNRCNRWKTWGYDRQGVWVDNGCRAEFRVGKDGGSGVGTGVAIGAIAGAAIIGAILAGKGDHKHESYEAPDWARGRFNGFSPKHETDFDLTIDRQGKVTGTGNGTKIEGHFTAGNRLHVGDFEFDTSRESWGFTAAQRDDKENTIYFRRR